MPKALLLANGRSRRGRQLRSQATEQLHALGIDLIVESHLTVGHFSDCIRYYRDRLDFVVVGGGDGTINATLSGLVETQLPFGVLPLGTANDFARTLDLPLSLEAACGAIAAAWKQQRLQAIDLGWVNDRYFLNVASIGLSSRITQNLTGDIKRKWGVFAYAIAAAQAMGNASPFRAEIDLGDRQIETKALQIAIGNGRHYGGGLTVHREAELDDGLLHLYILEVESGWQILPLLPALRQGHYLDLDRIRAFETRSATIRTDKPYKVNTDGELMTHTPATFRVVPEILNILIPPSSSPPNQ